MIRLLKEPLFHFLAIGLIIALLAKPSGEIEDRIFVSEQIQQQIAGELEQSLQRLPTDPELDEAYSQWIEDEIVYREAIDMGLDRNDPRIRKRVIDKYRSLIDVEVGEPSDEEIRQYYESNIGEFVKPRRYSLLVADDTTSENGNFRTRLSEYQVSKEFGTTILSKIAASQVNTWIGPVTVKDEQIAIKLIQAIPADTTSFEEARLYIPTSIKIAALREAQSQYIEPTRKSYRIEYE